MKDFLKNSGLLLIILAVVFLAIYAFQGMVTNTYLILSGFLLVGGLLAYVIMQRVMD